MKLIGVLCYLVGTTSWDETLRYTFFQTQLVLHDFYGDMIANENILLPFIVLLNKLLVLMFNFNKKVRRPYSAESCAVFKEKEVNFKTDLHIVLHKILFKRTLSAQSLRENILPFYT